MADNDDKEDGTEAAAAPKKSRKKLIIIAAAAPEVPQPLVQQLARTGVMVLPIGSEKNQRLARVRRVGTGVQIEDYGTAEFVPLVGRFGWKE